MTLHECVQSSICPMKCQHFACGFCYRPVCIFGLPKSKLYVRLLLFAIVESCHFICPNSIHFYECFNSTAKVIHPKYSKHWPYTVAYKIDCVCSKMLNHGLNHGLFLSLFKLIPCPIYWIVYLCVSLFKFHIWISK